jgi:uncharacterized protein
MASHSRIVLDKNVFVSALLASDSTPGLVVRWTLRNGIPLASGATTLELQQVLRRPKFAKLISSNIIDEFLTSYRKAFQLIPITSSLMVCRDPRDDKFLEVTVDGHADVIVSGDEDLLSLNPFQGIRFLTPQTFLAVFGAPPDETDHA